MHLDHRGDRWLNNNRMLSAQTAGLKVGGGGAAWNATLIFYFLHCLLSLFGLAFAGQIAPALISASVDVGALRGCQGGSAHKQTWPSDPGHIPIRSSGEAGGEVKHRWIQAWRFIGRAVHNSSKAQLSCALHLMVFFSFTLPTEQKHFSKQLTKSG